MSIGAGRRRDRAEFVDVILKLALAWANRQCRSSGQAPRGERFAGGVRKALPIRLSHHIVKPSCADRVMS
jgi:hypothetical protein